jgi:hypothetical protein
VPIQCLVDYRYVRMCHCVCLRLFRMCECATIVYLMVLLSCTLLSDALSMPRRLQRLPFDGDAAPVVSRRCSLRQRRRRSHRAPRKQAHSPRDGAGG